MVLEVYLDPCTVNSRKVLAGLDLLGTNYNFNHIDYFTGQHKSDEYKKINPNATVPAAVDGDCKITESNAILQYAADHGSDDTAYPKDLKKRANVNRWLLWEASVWFPSCYVYLVEYVVKPLLKAEPDQAVIDAEAPKWHKMASILDEQLGKTKYLTGDNVTIADIAVASPMHVHKAQRLPLDQHANLSRWLADIEELPSWKKTQGAVDKALFSGAATNGATNGDSNKSQASKVQTTFHYTKDLADKLTELYFYESEKAKGIHEPGDDPRQMAVHNGWDQVKEFTIDKNGFEVQEFKAGYDDWENEEGVREHFYPEVVDFLKKNIGAKRVLVFDHTIRTERNAKKKLTEEKNTSQRTPVMLVHCDYTAESGPLRVKQLLPDEAEDLLSRRVAFINVWKPIHRIVEERPLAMCDVKSTVDDDFFKLHLRYRDRNGENYVMRYNPAHKWYYFPKMTPDQVILLKTYDSETDGRARFVGHSAFEDPTSPPDAPLRESVEIRTIAFY